MKFIAKYVRLKENAIVPTRGSDYAAGYDLHACIDGPCDIAPHSTVKIGTGIAVQPPHEYFGAIFARSGLATKKGLRPANCVGVVDEDYTGECIVPLHNDTDEMMSIEPGDRIAQLVFLPYLNISFKEVDKLDETNRGDGGFGSSGN